jgi:hypothetical protein
MKRQTRDGGSVAICMSQRWPTEQITSTPLDWRKVSPQARTRVVLGLFSSIVRRASFQALLSSAKPEHALDTEA